MMLKQEIARNPRLMQGIVERDIASGTGPGLEYFMSGFRSVPTLQMDNGAVLVGTGQIVQYLKARAGAR